MTPSRRAFLATSLQTAIGAVVGGFSYGEAFERHRLRLTSEELPLSGLDPALDGVRVALLTDLHHSLTVPAPLIAQAVQMANAARPDVIILGGDFVSFADRAYIEPVADLLAPLTAPHGVFAVLGNHDDERATTNALTRRRITLLNDRWTRLGMKGAALDLAGVRFWTRRRDVVSALRGIGPSALLAAHDPRRIEEASRLDVGGVISGHTHGGQIVLPGLGAVAARRFPIAAGRLRRGNTWLFVSRGVGTVYAPVRLGCPPEVAVVTLRRQANY